MSVGYFLLDISYIMITINKQFLNIIVWTIIFFILTLAFTINQWFALVPLSIIKQMIL